LLVVDAYTTSWGYAPTEDGKVVWATLLASHASIDRSERR
jgi:hypothetical protein